MPLHVYKDAIPFGSQIAREYKVYLGSTSTVAFLAVFCINLSLVAIARNASFLSEEPGTDKRTGQDKWTERRIAAVLNASTLRVGIIKKD